MRLRSPCIVGALKMHNDDDDDDDDDDNDDNDV